MDLGGELVFTRRYCVFLDPATKLCTVYKRRFVVAPNCRTVAEAIEFRLLPSDCPYVEGIPGYRGPAEIEGVQMEDELW